MARYLTLWLLLICAAPVAAASGGKEPAQPPDTVMVHVGDDSTGTGVFVAWPESKAPAPAIIVAHEWWGLTAHIRTIAERLAREGYVGVVPDLYHGKVAEDADRAHILSRGLEYPAADRDIDSAVAWLHRNPRVDAKKTAVIGFCMGGGVALAYGLHSPDLSAVVMFYGPPFADSTQLAALNAPLMGHFGQLDEGIPPARANAFRDLLQKTGHPAEIYVYPKAGHAFMNDTRPSYSPEAAATAWSRTLAFLKKRLGN